jgi:hypothetical protein
MAALVGPSLPVPLPMQRDAVAGAQRDAAVIVLSRSGSSAGGTIPD